MLLLFFTESTKSSLFVLATLVSFLFKKIKNGFLYFSYVHMCVCVCVCVYIYIYIYGEGNCNLQYSCLENLMDGVSW